MIMNTSILNKKDIKKIADELKLELAPVLRKLEQNEKILNPTQKQSIAYYDEQIKLAEDDDRRRELERQREYWLQKYMLQNKSKYIK